MQLSQQPLDATGQVVSSPTEIYECKRFGTARKSSRHRVGDPLNALGMTLKAEA